MGTGSSKTPAKNPEPKPNQTQATGELARLAREKSAVVITPYDGPDRVSTLPDAAIFCIVTKLNDIDFGRFLLVCHTFAKFANNELFWMHRSSTLIGHTIPKQIRTWKETYFCYSQRVGLNAPAAGKRRITLPHSDDVWNSSDFSLCCWINLSSETARFDVICNKSDGNWACGFGIDITDRVTTGQFQLQAFVNQWTDFNVGENPDMVLSAQTVNVGEWIHVAVVCSSTHLTIYVNGIQGQEVAISKPVVWTNHPFTIGYTNWHGIDFYTKGHVCDFRVWSRPLTKEEVYQEIVSVVPESKDLTCFLPLNIIDQKKVLDLSEFRNHGTLDDECQVAPITCRWPPQLSTTAESPPGLLQVIRNKMLEFL